nr:DUF3592 domain-containing protein [Lactobacillus gasseri]
MDRGPVTYHESGNRYSHHSQDSRHHDVYIDYRYHGQRYTDIRLDTYTSSMQIGKKIKILINPQAPANPTIPGAGILNLAIWGGIGLVFTILGSIFLKYVFADRRRHRLKKTGQRVTAIVSAITDSHVTLNGVVGKIIECYYEEADERYHFESAPVFNSTALHGLNVGDTIYVYVDPNNYSHYYVEV